MGVCVFIGVSHGFAKMRDTCWEVEADGDGVPTTFTNDHKWVGHGAVLPLLRGDAPTLCAHSGGVVGGKGLGGEGFGDLFWCYFKLFWCRVVRAGRRARAAKDHSQSGSIAQSKSAGASIVMDIAA